MDILTIFFMAVGILNFSGGILSVVSWFFVRRRYNKKPILKEEKKVSIIIPCKEEIDLEKFENQNYNNYEIIIVVDSEEEAEEIRKKIRSRKTTVEISKKIGKSGKNAALLTGLEKAGGEIIVFADADIKPHKNWLYYLVASLGNISTTYRWYFESPLLCVWNSAIAAIFFYKKFNFAWGGSTAIKKDILKELHIEDIWRNEFVDDLTLTKEAKRKGYVIEFVPFAIVESQKEEEIFKWMNRQFAWVKYYFPWLWNIAFFFNIGMRVSNIVGIFFFFINPFIGFLLFSPILFDFIRGWQEYRVFAELMEYEKEKFISPIYHILLRPLASFIISYNLLSSLFIREIEWKGKKYAIQEVFQQRKA